MPYVCIYQSVSSLCVLHKKTTFVPRLYDAVEKGRGGQIALLKILQNVIFPCAKNTPDHQFPTLHPATRTKNVGSRCPVAAQLTRATL